MTTINSASQLQALRTELFTKADANNDKSLSLAEFSKISTGALEQTGVITTASDLKSSIATLFKKLDGDNDGKLTSDEIEQGASLTTQIHAALLQIQEAQDGTLLSTFLANSSEGGDGFSSLFNSGFGGTQDGSLASLFQQLILPYQQTAAAAQSEDSSSVSQSA